MPLCDVGGERRGDRIGPYTLLAKIGEGGFGVVWLAERREPMVQRVALKVIKPGMDSKTVIARFEQERQALAVMDHPNVARVLDGGVTPGGLPYFVMELVKGEPITDFADRHRLTMRQRLALFVPVCEAVQHAHSKGIIHRDLKPSNILVVPVGDADARDAASVDGMLVKVIDFGVAKAISRTLTERSFFTERGMLIGTPAYMSPEQAEMGATDIDTRSDVYSLGVVLYEMLSGTLPFDPRSLRDAAYDEIQRIIREVDPPRPSTKLSTADDPTGTAIARARQAERERLAGELRRELEWIPMKALRKDRRERYATAHDLAEDVRRYLKGDPLVAGPESTAYRLRKLLRRHRGPAAAAAAVVIALVIGLAGTWTQAVRAERERREAMTARREAFRYRDQAERDRKEAVRERDSAEAAKTRTEELVAHLSASQALEAALRSDRSAVDRELSILSELKRLDRFDVRLAGAMTEPECFQMVSGRRPGTDALTVFPLCVAEAANRVPLNLLYDVEHREFRLVDLSTRQAISTFAWELEHLALGDVGTGIEMNPDGTRAAAALRDHGIQLLRLPDGRPIGQPLRGHSSVVRMLAFSEDGRKLASVADDGSVRAWDLEAMMPEGEPLQCESGMAVSPRFATDGERLVVTEPGRGAHVWNPGSGEHLEIPASDITCAVFTPDGSKVAILGVSDLTGTFRLNAWDLSRQAMAFDSAWFSGTPNTLTFSGSGRWLAAATYDEGPVQLFDFENIASGPHLMRGLSGAIRLRFDREDRVLWAVDAISASVLEFDVGSPRSRGLWTDSRPDLSMISAAFTPAGDITLLCERHENGLIIKLDGLTGCPLGLPLSLEGCNPDFSALSPDGRYVADRSGPDDEIQVWETSAGTRLNSFPSTDGESRANAVAFGPHGDLLAIGGDDGRVRLRRMPDGSLLGFPMTGHSHAIERLAFTPDGSTLVSGDAQGEIRVWSISESRSIGDPISIGDGGPVDLCVSPEGLLVATLSGHGEIRVRSLDRRAETGGPLRQESADIERIAFAKDGTTLVGGLSDGKLQLWNYRVGRSVGPPLPGHAYAVLGNTFSPDGELLVTWDWKSLRFWESQPGRDRIEALRKAYADIDAARISLSNGPAADLIASARIEDLRQLEREVLGNAQLSREQRAAMLIVIGERARQGAKTREDHFARTEPLVDAIRRGDWRNALALGRVMELTDIDVWGGDLWHSIAHGILEAGGAELALQDLEWLSTCARRAVQRSDRTDAAMLATLARLEQALGKRESAAEIQREAVAAARARLASVTDEQLRASLSSSLEELEATLARYEREAAASAPAP